MSKQQHQEKKKKCGVCQSDLVVDLMTLTYMNPALEEKPINFYICEKCASIFHNERSFLPTDYYKMSYFNNPIRMTSLTESVDFIKNYLGDQVKGKTVLDVGCSNGNLMLLLQKMGFKTYGIELSEDARDQALKNGLDVYGSVDSLKGQTFDFLILSHIIEHSHSPFNLMDQYIPFLKEKGFLFIEVPSIGMLAEGHECSYNNLYPNHVYHFSEEGLYQLASSMGCSIMAIAHHHECSYPSLMCLAQKEKKAEHQVRNFQKHLYNEEMLVKNRAQLLEEELKNWSHGVIWGCSNESYQIVKQLTPQTQSKIILIDSDPKKSGKKVLSFEVQLPESLLNLDDILFFVAPTSAQVADSIAKSIEKISKGKNVKVL